MTSVYRKGLFAVLLCMGISIAWGTFIGNSRVAWVDFRAVYAGTRCLIHGHNPYKVSDVEREYLSEDGQRPSDSPFTLQVITLYVNVPTAFIFVAPFAALPWGPAHVLWMLLMSGAFTAALLLVWDAGARSALDASTLLACILAANCEAVFAGRKYRAHCGGFSVIAAWSLLSNRLVWLGVVCLGLSLAIQATRSRVRMALFSSGWWRLPKAGIAEPAGYGSCWRGISFMGLACCPELVSRLGRKSGDNFDAWRN